ncbi:hypothetical protein M378DRAFT_124187 [Amanita muscaria Koide BX008]|uniref:Transcriptional coactivator p15 (PC4) C-terminal domain-containing protein n=1 Tax=Amanita muscaria (strain Koide BX008) TaxID=946122 RepID=A0A0C2WWN0_AMAMK|nr:hypothetical protein M378DRAFT_124187 [Amanita muscaria Koide BX008]
MSQLVSHWYQNQVHRTEQGSSYIDIGKKRRVTVSMFKSMPLIDIREYYGADGDEKPGKKGISLSVDQWEIIKDNFDMIDQFLSDLKK